MTLHSCKVGDRKDRFKGFAFVSMSSVEEAQLAVQNTNGMLLDGVNIRVALDAGKGSKAPPAFRVAPPVVTQREVVLSASAAVPVKKGEKVCFSWRDTQKCRKGRHCSYPHMMLGEDGVGQDVRFSDSDVRMEISTGRDGRDVNVSGGDTSHSPATKARDSLTRGLTATRGGPAAQVAPVTPTLSFQQMLTAQYSKQ